MKLKHFNIKNVKSIIDSGVCHLSGDNITIFAGQNEAGKSAVLEALNYFTKGINDKFEKYSMRTGGAIPYVECCFELEPNDTEYDDENYTKVLKEIPVIKCYREGKQDVAFTEETRLLISSAIDRLLNNDSLSDNTEESEENSGSKCQIVASEFCKEIESSVLKYLPKFDYYDSFSNILPETIKIENIATNVAVQDFQTAFDINLADYVKLPVREKTQKKQTVEKNLKLNFNECWTQRLTGEDNSQYNFVLNDGVEGISFLIDRGDEQPLFVVQKSKGFQWFVAFYLRLKALQQDENNLTDYILLIDEPGQGLHEKAQMDVKNVLEELANKGMQILYTTHHPQLIDTEDKITRLRLVYQDPTIGTKVKTLPQMASLRGQQALDTLSPIRTAMGLINISCLELNNNKNVIVEGITDKYYIEAFAKLLNIELACNIIPSCGCENIKNIASILLGWGYKFKVIIDKGEGQNPQEDTTQRIIKEKLLAYDEEAEMSVIKRLSHIAIEDVFSKTDFRLHVKPEDIPHNNKNNVKLAKDCGHKELWARLFLEKVNTGAIQQNSFEEETIGNFREILSWIQGD